MRPGSAEDPAEKWIYVRSFLVTLIFIGTAFWTQVVFTIKRFEYSFLPVPFLMVLVIGTLLGRTFVLQRRLQKSSMRFHAVADIALEFTYFRRLDGSYLYASPACAELTGYRDEEFYAQPALMDQLIHPEDRARWSRHLEEIDAGGVATTLDLRVVHRDGQTVWINHLCAPVFDEQGAQTGVRSTNVNITERKLAEERIQHMALYDPLTDVPNRHSLVRHLEALITERTESGEPFAIFFLDLARFAHLNDSFGHEHGDRVLVELTRKLSIFCDDCRLFRFGGDEFVLISTWISEPQAALDYARRLVQWVEEPFIVDGKDVYLSGAVGIALYPFDGQDTPTLIRHADAAMYRAKGEHEASIQLFRPELIDSAVDFVGTEQMMRRGLTAGEFVPHFQPKVDLSDQRIIGFEALARWQKGDELVSPAKFIPIAEETGLIAELGRTMLEQACLQARGWCAHDRTLTMAVNVSGKQLAHPEFVGEVRAILEATGCDPSHLELEITEQVFLSDPAGTMEILWKLKDLGVTLALDDFGTGYSSLSYLKRLPFDTVKIDRSFTRDICKDARDVAILRAILALCGDLKLDTVIEGIETEQQLELLKGLGARKVQGFYFYRPMPADRIAELLDPA